MLNLDGYLDYMILVMVDTQIQFQAKKNNYIVILHLHLDLVQDWHQ